MEYLKKINTANILISFIYIYIYIYKRVGWKVHKLTVMECIWMRFIFQHSPPWGLHTSFIGVAVLGSQWSKKSLTADMMSAYKLSSTPSYIIFDRWVLTWFKTIFFMQARVYRKGDIHPCSCQNSFSRGIADIKHFLQLINGKNPIWRIFGMA